MAITFHKDSTVSLGSFIQVLASGRAMREGEQPDS